jgi:hypothetical protein
MEPLIRLVWGDHLHHDFGNLTTSWYMTLHTSLNLLVLLVVDFD